MSFIDGKAADFSAKGWINNALATSKNAQGEKTDISDCLDDTEKVSSLMLKVQSMATNLNSSIDDLMQQALQNIPRCVQEIERIRREAAQRNRRLVGAEETLGELESNQRESFIVGLTELDAVKSRIEACEGKLREARFVFSLSQDLKATFDSNAPEVNASKIKQLSDGLKNLPKTYFEPELESLVEYVEKLEGFLRPKVIRAVQQHIVGESSEYLRVFEMIDRRTQFMEVYYGACLSVAQSIWDKYVSRKMGSIMADFAAKTATKTLSIEHNLRTPPKIFNKKSVLEGKDDQDQDVEYSDSDDDGETSGSKAPVRAKGTTKGGNGFPPNDASVCLKSGIELWLSAVYSEIFEMIRNESLFVDRVFHSDFPVSVLPVLIYRILNQISRSVELSLAFFTKHVCDQQRLIFVTTPSSQQRLLSLLECYKVSLSYAARSCALVSSQFRSEVCDSFMKPYVNFQEHYPQLEYGCLQDEFETGLRVSIVPHSPIETVQKCQSAVSRAFDAMNRAVDRCIVFTDGLEAPGFIHSLVMFLDDYIEHQLQILHHLRSEARVVSINVSSAGVNRTGLGQKTVSGSYRRGTDDLVANDEGVGPNEMESYVSLFDAGSFHSSLQLLQVAVGMLNELRLFEKTLRNRLLSHRLVVFGGGLGKVSQKSSAKSPAPIVESNRGSPGPMGSSSPSPLLPAMTTSLNTSLLPYLSSMRENSSKLRTIQLFFASLESVTFRPLQKPMEKFSEFVDWSHTLVCDVMFVFIKERLDKLPTFSFWNQEEDVSGLDGAGDLPQFSLSPSSYVNLIGDHLVNVSQLLHPYSSNKVLLQRLRSNLTLSALPSFPAVSPGMLSQEYAAEADDARDEVVNANGFHAQSGYDGFESDEDVQRAFTHYWLVGLCERTQKLLVQKIMEINCLSEHGSRQLSVDLSYFGNVLEAIDMARDPILKVMEAFLMLANHEKAEFVAKEMNSQAKKACLVILNMLSRNEDQLDTVS